MFRWLKRNFSSATDAKCQTPESQVGEEAQRLIEFGNAAEDGGRLDEAMRHYQTAIRIAPKLARAHLNLGNVLLAKNDGEGAVAAFSTALALDAGYSAAHYNLGNALLQLNRPHAALSSYGKAIELNPEFVDAEVARGNALDDLGESELAAASFRRVLELRPDYAEAHSNLLFSHNYRLEESPTALLADAMSYGRLVEERAQAYTAWNNAPIPDRCLRVGLVSSDLRNHPVGFFVDGVVAALASRFRDKLELFVYSGNEARDTIGQRISANCRAWILTAGVSDEHLAKKIRDDRIDILIDLAGHTAGNRLPLFAWKPSPVQITWLGYFATTGVTAIDYLIADPWTLPPNLETEFTEKIWRLPETRLCFTPPDEYVEVSTLPALTGGRITFGCFNNLSKMNDEVVALWARVLAAVPGSILLLKAKQLAEESVRINVIKRFAIHGIDPTRLVLEGPVSRVAYLAAYQRVDVALDPFPFPGGTTSVEALWMGVPVLTLTGNGFLARQGRGLLANAGLHEWIAADTEDYVARAVRHTGDLGRLALLRDGLRGQVLASPIFDAPRFANHFEAALRGMWLKWCAAAVR